VAQVASNSLPGRQKPAKAEPTPEQIRRSMKRRQLLLTLSYPLPFIGLIIIWALAIPIFSIPENSLVPPLDVVKAAGDLIDVGLLAHDVSISLIRLLVSAILAIVIGIPIGLLLGSSSTLEMMFAPFFRFFQSVSGIALLPLLIMWFGFSETTIQVSILYTALVPVVFNTMTGVQTIPTVYKGAMGTFGASRLQVIRDVYIPGALSSMMVGIRLGIGYGWRALIAAEMLIGAGGLGFLVFDARRFHLIGQILVGMIVIGIIYVIVDRLILAPLEDATVKRWGMQRS
jgi:taurine transport system permease protein